MNHVERRDDYIDLADKISSINVCIATGFAKTNAQHEAIMSCITEMKEDQERVLHTIYGNGREGLTTMTAKLAQKVHLIWVVLSASIASLASLTIAPVKEFIEHFLK